MVVIIGRDNGNMYRWEVQAVFNAMSTAMQVGFGYLRNWCKARTMFVVALVSSLSILPKERSWSQQRRPGRLSFPDPQWSSTDLYVGFATHRCGFVTTATCNWHQPRAGLHAGTPTTNAPNRTGPERIEPGRDARQRGIGHKEPEPDWTRLHSKKHKHRPDHRSASETADTMHATPPSKNLQNHLH